MTFSFFYVSLIVCDSVSEQFWISSLTDTLCSLLMKSWGLSSSASKLATIDLIRNLRSFPKSVLELFMFTLLCSDLQGCSSKAWQQMEFHIWLCCLPRNCHDPYLFIYFSDSGNQCYIWIPDCLFVRGREIPRPAVHWMFRLFFLIIRHVSCYNISFCHHHQIVFLNIMW